MALLRRYTANYCKLGLYLGNYLYGDLNGQLVDLKSISFLFAETNSRLGLRDNSFCFKSRFSAFYTYV